MCLETKSATAPMSCIWRSATTRQPFSPWKRKTVVTVISGILKGMNTPPMTTMIPKTMSIPFQENTIGPTKTFRVATALSPSPCLLNIPRCLPKSIRWILPTLRHTGSSLPLSSKSTIMTSIFGTLTRIVHGTPCNGVLRNQ